MLLEQFVFRIESSQLLPTVITKPFADVACSPCQRLPPTLTQLPQLYHVSSSNLLIFPSTFQAPAAATTYYYYQPCTTMTVSRITHTREKNAPHMTLSHCFIIEGGPLVDVNKRKSPQFRLVSNVWVLQRRKQKPDTRKWISSYAIQLFVGVKYRYQVKTATHVTICWVFSSFWDGSI